MQHKRRITSEGKQDRTLLIPKLCGADIELGNAVLGLDRAGGTSHEASLALLREISGIESGQGGTVYTTSPYGGSYADYTGAGWGHDSGFGSPQQIAWSPGYGTEGYVSGCSSGYSAYGVQNRAPASAWTYSSNDYGRKFLPCNGSCVYIDLSHLELCLPEVLSAFDHVAAWHSMLRIARNAMNRANSKLPSGQLIQVLANNSDGYGNSYGSHLNFLISRKAWDNIFYRKLHYMLFLATYLVSSVVFSGQGKAGSENQAPEVDFQLSQRADFFECLAGEQTTYNRPIVNSRDEALSRENDLARLHVIFFDNTLCHFSSLLKTGATQIILAMIEAGRINSGLILEDPLEAVLKYSHDPTLTARSETVSGRKLTAAELQMCFIEEAHRFVEEGGCEGVVPRAGEILALWEDTVQHLKCRNLKPLIPRVDWVLKLFILRRSLQKHPELNWKSPELKTLDHLYSSLDPREGLYWIYESKGGIDRVVDDSQIEHFSVHPPEDTRAWSRSKLLSTLPESIIEGVDWDSIRIAADAEMPGEKSCSVSRERLEMSNPLSFGRADTEHVFEKPGDLKRILDAFKYEPEASG